MALLLGLTVVLALAGVVAPRRALSARVDLVALVLATVLLVRLGTAFVGRDWSLRYVADHTRAEVGPLLRLAGLWAGSEGSLLLWTAMTRLPRAGIAELDLGGLNTADAPGIARFKLGTGARVKALCGTWFGR